MSVNFNICDFNDNTRYHGVELGQVAAVKKLLGVKFNIIKVVCILFFRTISISSKA